MAIPLQIGNQVFNYPESGADPGWAESAVAWSVAVTSALSNITTVGDIPLTSFQLINNQSTPAIITGLQLVAGLIRAANVQYVVYRKSNTSSVIESGTMYVNYDASGTPVFKMSIVKNGNAGVTFDIDGTGQISYTTSNITGTIDATNHYIKFSAKALPS